MKYFSTQTQASLGVCGFFVGAKGVGIGQNEENYRLEFLGKPPDLSSAKAEKFDLFYFCGFGEWGRFLGEFGGDLRDILGGQRFWLWSD